MSGPGDKPSLVPKPKIIASAVAGAIVVIAVWGLKTFAHVDQPVEVIGAEVVLVSTVVGYLVPDAS